MSLEGNIPNLWPEFPDNIHPITPKAVLSRQASVITEKTAGHVVGTMETKVLGRDFTHTLTLVAPKLDNYTHFVIRIRHSIEHMYPVYVFISNQSDSSKECIDEGTLYTMIRERFSSENVVHMLQSLIAQSDEQ